MGLRKRELLAASFARRLHAGASPSSTFPLCSTAAVRGAGAPSRSVVNLSARECAIPRLPRRTRWHCWRRVLGMCIVDACLIFMPCNARERVPSLGRTALHCAEKGDEGRSHLLPPSRSQNAHPRDQERSEDHQRHEDGGILEAQGRGGLT